MGTTIKRWQNFARSTPRLEDGLQGLDVKMVAAGEEHILILTDQQQLYSYGNNSYGQLGHGDMTNRTQKTLIESFASEKFIYIACGAYHSSAVSESGSLYCWGRGSEGQIGNGKNEKVVSLPHNVRIDIGKHKGADSDTLKGEFIKVSCGDMHTVAVTKQGKCYSCGSGDQTGIGLTYVPSLSIVSELSSVFVLDVACGAHHTIAIAIYEEFRPRPYTNRRQMVFSWGRGENGQLCLPNNDLSDKAFPHHLSQLSEMGIISVVAGRNHTVGLRWNGTALFWGQIGSSPPIYGESPSPFFTICLKINSESKLLSDPSDPSDPSGVEEAVSDDSRIDKCNSTLVYNLIPLNGKRILNIASGQDHLLFLCLTSSAKVQLYFFGPSERDSDELAFEKVDTLNNEESSDEPGHSWISGMAAGWRQSICFTRKNDTSSSQSSIIFRKFLTEEIVFLKRIKSIEEGFLSKLCDRSDCASFVGQGTLNHLLHSLQGIVANSADIIVGVSELLRTNEDPKYHVSQLVKILNNRQHQFVGLFQVYLGHLGNIVAMNLFNFWKSNDHTFTQYVEECYTFMIQSYTDDDESLLEGLKEAHGFFSKANIRENSPIRNLNLDLAERAGLLEVLYIPFVRLQEIKRIIETLLDQSFSGIYHHDLQKLNWRLNSLTRDFEKDLADAYKTSNFWESNPILCRTLMLPHRRLIAHSKQGHSLTQAGVWFGGSPFFILFNDTFVHVAWKETHVMPLQTLWMKTNIESNNSFTIFGIEYDVQLTCQNQTDKLFWTLNILEAITKVLRAKHAKFEPTVNKEESYAKDRKISFVEQTNNGLSFRSPLSYTFSENHPLYKLATFIGSWCNGKMHGKGRLIFPEGSEHIGYWVEGKRNGWGVSSSSTGEIYKGTFLNNLRHGYGSFLDIKGNDYVGSWQYGAQSGHGTYQMKDGSLYVGNWLNGTQAGYGIYKNTATQEKYLGQWKSGKRTGKGIISNQAGVFVSGNFLNDKLHGDATIIFPDQVRSFEGEWSQGHVYGKGCLSFPDGSRIQGHFYGKTQKGSSQENSHQYGNAQNKRSSVGQEQHHQPSFTSSCFSWDNNLKITNSVYSLGKFCPRPEKFIPLKSEADGILQNQTFIKESSNSTTFAKNWGSLIKWCKGAVNFLSKQDVVSWCEIQEIIDSMGSTDSFEAENSPLTKRKKCLESADDGLSFSLYSDSKQHSEEMNGHIIGDIHQQIKIKPTLQLSTAHATPDFRIKNEHTRFLSSGKILPQFSLEEDSIRTSMKQFDEETNHSVSTSPAPPKSDGGDIFAAHFYGIGPAHVSCFWKTKKKISQTVTDNDKNTRSEANFDIVQKVLKEVIESQDHILGKFLEHLVFAYKSSYEGSGGHRYLLRNALLDLESSLDCLNNMYLAVFSDLKQLESTKDDSPLKRKELFDLGVEAGLLEPLFMPYFYNTIYFLYEQNVDDTIYWRNVQFLGDKCDLNLLAYLGLQPKFWLLTPEEMANGSQERKTSNYYKKVLLSMQKISIDDLKDNKNKDTIPANGQSFQPPKESEQVSPCLFVKRNSNLSQTEITRDDVTCTIGPLFVKTRSTGSNPSKDSNSFDHTSLIIDSINSDINHINNEIVGSLDSQKDEFENRDSDVYKNNREEGNFSVCNIGTDDNKNSGKCESVRSSKSSCGHGDCSNSTQTQNRMFNFKESETRRSSCISTKCENYKYQSAINCFSRLPTAHSPLHKIQIIQNTLQELRENVSDFGLKDTLWGMDDLLPLLIFVIIRARVWHLGSEICFLEDLLHRADALDMEVMLTTLKAAYLYIRGETNYD